MPAKGQKKITPSVYSTLKKQIASKGEAAVIESSGYSRSTIKSVAKGADYDSWRTRRREMLGGKRRSAPVEPLRAVVPSQSPVVELKKPGRTYVPPAIKRQVAEPPRRFIAGAPTRPEEDQKAIHTVEQIDNWYKSHRSPWQRIKDAVMRKF